jgi:hypothetical protein
VTAIHAGGLPDAWNPGQKYSFFHRYCVPAKFREVWLFLTEKPRGQWRSYIDLR